MKLWLSMLFIAGACGACAQPSENIEHQQYYVISNYSWVCDKPVRSEACRKKSLYGYSFSSELSEGQFYRVGSTVPGLKFAGKWISKNGVISSADFEPVKNWDIKYLFVNSEFLMDLYIFDRNANYVIDRYFEDGGRKVYKNPSRLYRYENLIVKVDLSGEKRVPVFSEALGVMVDDAGKIVCPLEYYRRNASCQDYIPPKNKYTRWYALNYLQFNFEDSVRPIYYGEKEIDLTEIKENPPI